jgi:hypothetical protein
MEDIIKLVRDVHAQACFADCADDLCLESSHQYAIAVSLLQQAFQTLQLADLAQTRELAKGRA